MPAFWSTLFTIVPPAIAYVWAAQSFPAVARHRRALLAALGLFAVAQLAVHGIATHTHSPVAGAAHVTLMFAGVTLAVASLPIGLVVVLRTAVDMLFRMARGVARGRRGAAGGPDPAEPESSSLCRGTDAAAGARVVATRRQVVEGGAGIGLFAGTGGMLAWGIARGRHAFQLNELAVPIPGLPRALDGYVIAQISDIHTGEYVGEREIDEGLAVVRAARPDLVVVTGDLVDEDARFAPLIARKLSDLPARDGVVASLGNHDYYTGVERLKRVLRSAGVAVLVDDGRVIRPDDGGGFALLGVDDLSSRHFGRSGPRLDRALAAVPADRPRILLSHQPPTIDRWPGQVALQLSGHTHGGQINPASILNPIFEYTSGRYEIGGSTLYVSRGFGTVGPPARIGSPPEVTRIVLVAA